MPKPVSQEFWRPPRRRATLVQTITRMEQGLTDLGSPQADVDALIEQGRTTVKQIEQALLAQAKALGWAAHSGRRTPHRPGDGGTYQHTAAIGTPATRICRRRRPERTALYRLVQQHLGTWLAVRCEADPDGSPVPTHVERKLRGYLECGLLACGFARARCGACGHDFLVAFSCKGRGICPS